MEDPHHTLANNLLDGIMENVLRMITTNDGWQPMDAKDGVTGLKMPSDEGPQTVKTTAIINKSADEVLAFLWNFNNKRITDDALKEIRQIKAFGERCRIMYEQTNAPWPVSNRDFVYAQRIQERDDGFVILGKSIDIGEPEVKGVVRAETIYIGHYIRRLPDGNSQLTVVGCVDPKGSIPKAVVNKMGKKQVGKLIALKKAIGG